METTKDAPATNVETDRNARHVINPIRDEEPRIAALRALAGRRKGDPHADEWMAEIEKFRERLRQEEIARQEEAEARKGWNA